MGSGRIGGDHFLFCTCALDCGLHDRIDTYTMVRPLLFSTGLAIVFALFVWGGSDVITAPLALAQKVDEGLGRLEDAVNTPTGTVNFREALGNAIRYVVDFVALAAVITIVVSGFILIFGFGSEGSIQRTKKIFIYTSLGVLISVFVRVIVGFFTEELAGTINN